jgi:hypothetical protein
MQEQDAAETNAGESMPPTYWGFTFEWAVKPMIGLLGATYALWLTHFSGGWLVPLIASVAATALGYYAYRFAWLKWIAIGWIASSMACVIIVLIDLLRFGR